jgi:hypothetical protein
MVKLNYTNEVIRASKPLEANVQKHVYTVWPCLPNISLQKALIDWHNYYYSLFLRFTLECWTCLEWNTDEIESSHYANQNGVPSHSSSLLYSLLWNDFSSVEAVYKLASLSKTGNVFWNESPVYPQWAMQGEAFIILHTRGTSLYYNINMPGRQTQENHDKNNNNPVTDKLWALTCNHKT